MTKEDILSKKEQVWIDEEREMEDETSHIAWNDCLSAMEEYTDYWRQRCEAAENVIINAGNDGFHREDYNRWYSLWEQTKKK